MKINVRKWLGEMRERFRDNPTRALLYIGYTWYLVFWYAVTSRFPIGTNVYERDWDLLIVLDACRIDALREVADEYNFIDNVEETWSVGSQSDEWMSNTFTQSYEKEIERTQYITANGHAGQLFEHNILPPKNNTTPVDLSNWDLVSLDTFDTIEMVWRNYHDSTYQVALPRIMTDHAIKAGRENDPDRLLVHYMQPHRPYVGQAISENRRPTDLEIEGYKKIETGDADPDEVYDLYIDTLRFVLDEIEILLENINADRVLITADHGEAFGEFKAYGHPEGFLHPVVKKVPLVRTSANDEKTRDPNLEIDQDTEVDLEQHLRDLGYR